MKLLVLLREAGPHPKNKKVIAKFFDVEPGVVTTNEAEIEGWSELLPEKIQFINYSGNRLENQKQPPGPREHFCRSLCGNNGYLFRSR